MNEFKVEVISIVEHFKADIDSSINGLYIVKIKGEKSIIFRNGESWGILAYFMDEPVTKCVRIIRKDRIEPIKNAINDYLEALNEKATKVNK